MRVCLRSHRGFLRLGKVEGVQVPLCFLSRSVVVMLVCAIRRRPRRSLEVIRKVARANLSLF